MAWILELTANVRISPVTRFLEGVDSANCSVVFCLSLVHYNLGKVAQNTGDFIMYEYLFLHSLM